MTQMLNTGDLGLIHRFRRSPGGGHGNLLWYSCLENLHKQRSLVGYSPWGHKVLDRTEWLRPAHTDMKRCKHWNREISSWKQLTLQTSSTRFPGSQSARIQPEVPQGRLNIDSLSTRRFILHRGRWQTSLLFSCWQCSWQMSVCRWQYSHVFTRDAGFWEWGFPSLKPWSDHFQ